MEFGKILQDLMELHGLTQKELSNELHIAPSTLGNYIRNYREPDYETLKMIAGYFKVSIDYLLDYHIDSGDDYQEHQLLHIFRQMDPAQQEIFLEQGKVVVRFRQTGR